MKAPLMSGSLGDVPGGVATADESARLREALAFIDDLDLDGDMEGDDSDGLNELLGLPSCRSSLYECQSASTCVGAQQSVELSMQTAPEVGNGCKPPQSRKSVTSNRSRTRRREEVIYLRGMVAELEEGLAAMRMRVAEQHAEVERAKESEQDRSAMITAWEQVASRQCEARQKSEIENLKLRRLLEDQIQMGKSLERLLMRKRHRFDQFASPQDLEAKRPRRYGSSISDPRLSAQTFDELSKTLDILYVDGMAKVLAVYSSMTKPNERKLELVPCPGFGMKLQTVENRILPFGYDATCEEVWAAVPEIMSRDKIHHISDVEINGNTVKVQFSLTAEVGTIAGFFNVKTVSRRHVEAHRTVIVTTALVNPSEISGIKMDGIYMKYHGWYIIEPVNLAAGALRKSATSEATRVFSHTYGIPEAFAGVSDHLQKVGALSNFVLSAMSADFDIRYHTLADRLLQRTIR